jgi:hypothetical protein
MKIYLVENCENSPGKIMAIFAHKADAVIFADQLEKNDGEFYSVEERKLHHGQPERLGFNQ